jgi:hypothetical protein
MNRYLLVTIALLVAVTGCRKPKTESASNQSDQTKIVACSLITNDEVQKIQDSPVKDTKPSESADSSFRMSQCFYSTEVFNKSVSLAVTQRNPDSTSARDPKTFWKETFGRYEGQVKEREGDEEKKKSLTEEDEERGTPPKRIEGVGDDAWWSANRMGGALYVLKNNVFIRISLGGPDTEEAKIEKSKSLVAKALSRL